MNAAISHLLASGKVERIIDNRRWALSASHVDDDGSVVFRGRTWSFPFSIKVSENGNSIIIDWAVVQHGIAYLRVFYKTGIQYATQEVLASQIDMLCKLLYDLERVWTRSYRLSDAERYGTTITDTHGCGKKARVVVGQSTPKDSFVHASFEAHGISAVQVFGHFNMPNARDDLPGLDHVTSFVYGVIDMDIELTENTNENQV